VTPSILIDGKFILPTKPESVQDDFSRVGDYEDFSLSKFKRSKSQIKDGPAFKKHKAVMYAVKQSMRSAYDLSDPQSFTFMERAIKRKQDKLNLKPNKFISSEVLSSFELRKHSEFEKAKEASKQEYPD